MANTKDITTENLKPGAYSLIDLKHAYIAGIVDGEGCVSISCHIRKGRKNYEGSVSVSSTTKELTEWLYKELGGCCYAASKRANPKLRQGYIWVQKGKKALATLKHLYPYCIVKRKQIEVYAKYYQSILEWRLQAQGKHGVLDEATVKKRDSLIDEMHRLNKGGG